MTDPMDNLKYRQWIPTVEKLTLQDYERHVLGLSPKGQAPFQMMVHDDEGVLCIHTQEMKFEGHIFSRTMIISEEVVVQQHFDPGGYYLAPEVVRGK